MPRKSACVLLVVLLLMVALTWAAQKNSAENPKYDPAKEIKFKGSVEEIKEVPGAKGEIGIQLVIKTGGELIEARLCPNSFLKEFEVTFAKGDQLEITGSKVNFENKEIVLVREIVRGNTTLVLRDKQGAPVWTWLKRS